MQDNHKPNSKPEPQDDEDRPEGVIVWIMISVVILCAAAVWFMVKS